MPSSTLESLLRDCMSRRNVPGLSLATLRGGHIDTLVALGSRGPHDAAPVDPHTVFEAASLTKPLVSYIAMRLVYAIAGHKQDFPTLLMKRMLRI